MVAAPAACGPLRVWIGGAGGSSIEPREIERTAGTILFPVPKPRHKPTPAPPPKRSYRLWVNVIVGGLALTALVVMVVLSANTPDGASSLSTTGPASGRTAATPGIRITTDAELARLARLSARDLVAMSDAELEAMDPLVMNMVVARDVPELAEIDFTRYARLVDGWADRIGRGLAASEAVESRTSPAYQADPDIWRAGGMAVALAGPTIGIAYTREIDMSNHADLFVPGLIDTKRGTCSNMPVLYMAVAHRLGWPLKAVVAADHMWCRWDDGTKQFNLEATSTTSTGGEGAFSTPPDESYMTDLRVSPKAVEVGSDMTTLTARQTLGVYLQQRSAYFRETDSWEMAEEDLLLARVCFPENRDIFHSLLMIMGERAKHLFAPTELARPFDRGPDPVMGAYSPRRAEQERLLRQKAEIERINRENCERLERDRQLPR